MATFTDFVVWKKSHSLVLEVYKLSGSFPKTETYALTNQIRRAAVSITSNIAEGYGRISSKEKTQFIAFAMGSTREVQNQIMIARDLGYVLPGQSDGVVNQGEEIVRMLYTTTKILKSKPARG